LLPTTVAVIADGATLPVLTIKRSGFIRFTVRVLGSDGRLIGRFKSKVFSLGGGFFVFDDHGQQVAEVKGD